jgi:diguanylate cyclase (GGDEF)-like protein
MVHATAAACLSTEHAVATLVFRTWDADGVRVKADRGWTRLRAAGLVLGVCAWLGLIAGLAALVAGSQANARREIDQRLQARTRSGAEFASLYVRDILRRERRVATIELAARRTSPRSLARASEAIGVTASVLLDHEGRLLQVLPAKPAMLGKVIIGKYPHLASAVAGRAAVSNVVPSAALGLPIVAFATPFVSGSGRRVFSGGFNVSATPLGEYMSHMIVTPGRRVFLVDATGRVIASSSALAKRADTLALVDHQLARRTRTQSVGSYQSASGRQEYVSVNVAGTPWRIVVTVPDSQLYRSVNDSARWLAWIAIISLAVAGLVIIALGSWLLRSRRELDRVARVDSMTGLRNRRDTEETLVAAVSAARRRQRSVAVLLIDIDHFKHVNDTHGHRAGDLVLVNTGQAIRTGMRTEDSLGRWGGEEFLAVLPDTDAEGAMVIAERLRTQVSEQTAADGLPGLTVTIGVAVWDSGEANELVSRADGALYAGKAAGRDNVQLAPAAITEPSLRPAGAARMSGRQS